MAECRSCRAPIVWARMTSGKAVPLNPDPVPNGNIRFNPETEHAQIVTGDDMWGDGEHRYQSHFATCPTAAQHRRTKRELKAQ